MKPFHFSRWLVRSVYWVTRIFVIALSVLAVLAVGCFIFLRIHGVPEPLLREVMRRVNARGVPVAVDSITLTLHGWRANHVRYYSTNPDDLKPLFVAEQVYFSVRNSRERRAGSSSLGLDVKAVDVEVNPSVEWGVDLPRESPFRKVERAEVSLGFHPDRIELSHGRVDWMNARFEIDGTILKRDGQLDLSRGDGQATLFPVRITEQQVARVDRFFEQLTTPEGAAIDIDFSVDTARYAESWVNASFSVEQLEYREVVLSRLEATCSYAYPLIQIQRIGFFKEKQSLQVSGSYNLASGQAEGSLYNAITSSRLLTLLPEAVHDVMDRAGLQFEELPRIELRAGPSAPSDLLNHLTGAFSIRGLIYQGLGIESLRGTVRRENNRLEFTDLHGLVRGQEERAGETGSAMRGGTAAGTVFWDGNTREFGVTADTNFDPTLLVQPLAFVEIATNIICRFSFPDRAPQAHVELGSNVEDWSTFFINIRGLADDVVFQGVEFSSINVVQTYRNAQLHLDPVTALQGSRLTKGFAHMDFRSNSVTFDAESSLSPGDLEDLIYPDLHLFGHHITTEGDVQLSASGTFDWARMVKTDFTASVAADSLRIPVAEMDGFTADVTGSGSSITVSNAVFGLYDGNGEGRFAMQWAPPRRELPYEIDFAIADVDFMKFMEFFYGEQSVAVSGKLQGEAAVEADFSTNFFNTANGSGSLQVRNGQLADLRFFQGFSRLMRKVIPSFTVFTITGLKGSFTIDEGVIRSDDAYFGGDFISAKGHGSYTHPDGFDAYVQAQVLRDGGLAKVVQVLTDPLMRLLKMRIEGPLANPSWKLDNF